MRTKEYRPVSLFVAVMQFAGWGGLFGFAFGVLAGAKLPSTGWVIAMALAAVATAGLLLNRMIYIRVFYTPTNVGDPEDVTP